MFLFRSRVDHHHYYHADDETKASLNFIIQKLKKMGEKTDQALADLSAIQDKLQKIGTESTATLQKVTELEEAAANSDTPQAVLDKIAEVKAQAQVVDDLVPDATSEEATPDA